MTPNGRTLQDQHDTPLTLSESEAAAAVLVAAVAVDGVLRDEEARRLGDTLMAIRWIGVPDQEGAGYVTGRVLELIGAHGLAAVMAASAAAIPPPLRDTMFALAADLVLADGRLSSMESDFLGTLRQALHVEERLAKTMIDVLSIKNRANGSPDL